MATVVVIRFRDCASASGLVAGLPAAARAVRQAALAGLGECRLEIGGGTPLPAAVSAEIHRLAGAMQILGPGQSAARGRRTGWPDGAVSGEPVLVVRGEDMIDAPAIRAARAAGASINPALSFMSVAGDGEPIDGHRPWGGDDRVGAGDEDGGDIASHYARAGRAIVKATAKSTDGLVSRSINRPISQTISNILLRIPGIRPIHATMGTAVLAILMFATLIFLGSPAGLVAGAILFQAASVFDGVDGEIARATYRTSDRGAMLDSLIDAATNLSFVAGIVINLAQRRHWGPAMFGIAGLAMLAIGLTTLGMQARRSGAPISFDGLKARFRDSGSGWGKWMVWLTMRDFLALASFVLVVAGLTDQAIMAFSAIMAVWLMVVLTAQVRQSAFGR